MYLLVARFLTQKGHYSSEKNIVKPSAFLPNRNRETSVFGIDNLSHQEIISIGLNNISTQSGTAPKGRAEILTKEIYNAKLDIDYNDIPPRHCNIINWPEQKHSQKLKALILASKSVLYLHI